MLYVEPALSASVLFIFLFGRYSSTEDAFDKATAPPMYILVLSIEVVPPLTVKTPEHVFSVVYK